MGHRAYEYLLKPIDMKKLDRVINEALKTLHLKLRDVGLSVLRPCEAEEDDPV